MTTIPAYVYQNRTSERSLLQGDILKVDGDFRRYFNEFYPAIDHSEGKDKYVMILTQSCDLVKTGSRKPKLSHINVCLVRSLKTATQKILTDEIKPTALADKQLLPRDALDQLKDRLSKLLNNSDQKTLFFLPNQPPFTEDMVAILPLSFSFRTDHYDLLLKNRVLGLKPEFQAKVGHIISQLYGRIGTPDLSDFEWDDKKTRNYINNLLQDANLVQVPDRSFIDYIKSNLNDTKPNIDELIQECEAWKVEKSFTPVKNELIQNIKNQLIRLFENKDQINSLAQLDKKELSKKIADLLQSAVKNP